MLDYNQLEQQFGVTSQDTTKIPGINPTASKLEQLAKANDEKLNRLAQHVNDDTKLPMSGTQGEHGVYGNMWNPSAEELQLRLSNAVDSQLYKDENGYYQQVMEDGKLVKKPYTGETRNLYIDNTQDGNMKLGLAASDVKEGITPFEARYRDNTTLGNPYTNPRVNKDGTSALYDGTPGPRGVTTADGALMDILLPKDVATQFEYDVHRAKGQMANRAAGQGPISAEDAVAFGSGKTEYSTQNAPLWNIDYKDSGELADGTPTPYVPYGFMADGNKKAEYGQKEVTANQYAAYKAALAEAEGGKVNVPNIVKNVASDVGTFATDFVDTLFDLGANIGQRAYEGITGKKITEEDLNNLQHLGFEVDANGNVDHKWSFEKEGTETAQAFDNLLGIDDTAYNMSVEKFGNKIDEVLHSDKSALEKTGEVLATAYKHIGDLPQMVSSSLTYVAALGKAPVQMLMAATNSHLEEAKKNNNGNPADAKRVMQTLGVTAVELGADYIAGKLTFGLGKGLGEVNRKVVDTMFKALPKKGAEGIIASTMKSVAKRTAGVAASMAEEAPTEMLQTTLGILVERMGTEKYDGKAVWELLDDEARAEIRKAGYVGAFAGGGQHVAGGVIRSPLTAAQAIADAAGKKKASEDAPKMGWEDVPDGVMDKAVIKDLSTFDKVLGNNRLIKEFKAEVDAGRGGDPENKEKFAAITQQALNNLGVVLDQMGATDKLTPDQVVAKQVIVEKLAEYELFKSRYIEQTGNKAVLNSRPIKQVQEEIQAVEAQLQPDAEGKLPETAGKMRAKLKTLKIEEMISKMLPDNEENVATEKGKATAQDSLGLKFHGGTVGDSYKQGILDFARLLADDTLRPEVRANIEAKLQYFLNTQEKKMLESEAAREEWITNGDVEQYTDDSGEIQYRAKNGTNPVVKYTRSGSEWKFHENSQEQLLQEQDEYRMLQAAAQAALSGDTTNIEVGPLMSARYKGKQGKVAKVEPVKVDNGKVTAYLNKQFNAGKTADEMIGEAKAELGAELSPALQQKIRDRLAKKSTPEAVAEKNEPEVVVVDGVKEAQQELFLLVRTPVTKKIRKGLEGVANAEETVEAQVAAINKMIGADYKPVKNRSTKQKLYEIREKLLGKEPQKPAKKGYTPKQAAVIEERAEAYNTGDKFAVGEVVQKQMQKKKKSVDEIAETLDADGLTELTINGIVDELVQIVVTDADYAEASRVAEELYIAITEKYPEMTVEEFADDVAGIYTKYQNETTTGETDGKENTGKDSGTTATQEAARENSEVKGRGDTIIAELKKDVKVKNEVFTAISNADGTLKPVIKSLLKGMGITAETLNELKENC